MKNGLKWIGAAVGALSLVTGCARSSHPTAAKATDAKTAPAPQRLVADNPDGQTETFEVRIRGVEPGAFTSVMFDIPDLSATADGAPLTIAPDGDRVNLGMVDQAWLLGRVSVPAGVSQVDFTLGFDDAGAFESPAEAGRIDARHVTVSWSSPIESLRTNGHVVVVLDLADSLVRIPEGGRALVPQLLIQY